MIELSVYINNQENDAFINNLMQLPPPLVPIHFAQDEKVIVNKNEDKVLNVESFEDFKQRNPLGFFLYSSECEYDLKYFSDTDYFNVFMIFSKGCNVVELVPEFFKRISPNRPIFGYAANFEERNHRNRHFIKFGMNNIESWVGRDIDKYIPGFYWYTVLSRQIMEKHGVSLSDILPHVLSSQGNDIDTIVLQSYEDPNSWEAHADKIDALCEELNGVFSIIDVQKAARGCKSYLEYNEAIEPWP